MKNHYLEQFEKIIKKYVQVQFLRLTNAEAANLEGASARRRALKEAEKLILKALENLKK